MKPVGPIEHLYIHIPFCERVCVYCDFAVTTQRKAYPRFAQILISEVRTVSEMYDCSELKTLYFGGGTPSLLPVDLTRSIYKEVQECFGFANECEVTLEANPNDLTATNLAAWRELGVNRLSIGIQSFQEEDLRALSRVHSVEQAHRAVEMARASGFANINIDLIFGVPGQSVASWQRTLNRGLLLEPDHFSIYNLTVEEGTPLERFVAKGKVQMGDEDQDLQKYLAAVETLVSSGYEHYEVSNYAREGLRSKHNQNYWLLNPYLGLGPSAHSYVHPERWWNVRSLRNYLDRGEQGLSQIDDREQLTRTQQVTERILLGLRTADGLEALPLESMIPSSFSTQFAPALDACASHLGFLNGRVRLTDRGMFLYNSICGEFLKCLG